MPVLVDASRVDGTGRGLVNTVPKLAGGAGGREAPQPVKPAIMAETIRVPTADLRKEGARHVMGLKKCNTSGTAAQIRAPLTTRAYARQQRVNSRPASLLHTKA